MQPIYVSSGLAWEASERELVAALLDSVPLRARVRPLVALTVDMQDVYNARHWAITGNAPGYHTPDEEVYLPGRNIILLGKAGVYCATARIGRLVIGTLRHNPFPDATPEFFQAMASALSLGLAHAVEIKTPLTAHKAWSSDDAVRFTGDSLGALPHLRGLDHARQVNDAVHRVHVDACQRLRLLRDQFRLHARGDARVVHDLSRGPPLERLASRREDDRGKQHSRLDERAQRAACGACDPTGMQKGKSSEVPEK